MQIKRYRLIKDLPDLKAGAIFQTERDGYGWEELMSPSTKKHWWYSKGSVENDHDWFMLHEIINTYEERPKKQLPNKMFINTAFLECGEYADELPIETLRKIITQQNEIIDYLKSKE